MLGKLGDDFVPQKSPGKTGKESLAERWILHKFTTAAKEINQALADREFSRSTQIAYQYWYDQLCDTYIVCLRAVAERCCADVNRKIRKPSFKMGQKKRENLLWIRYILLLRAL